jgi:hypothetical protein
LAHDRRDCLGKQRRLPEQRDYNDNFTVRRVDETRTIHSGISGMRKPGAASAGQQAVATIRVLNNTPIKPRVLAGCHTTAGKAAAGAAPGVAAAR